jgi:hypothetical protein
MTLLHRLLRPALAWPAESQHRARRNALVASTALAQRRQELREVEEFLELHDRRLRSRPAHGRPLPAAGQGERRDAI